MYVHTCIDVCIYTHIFYIHIYIYIYIYTYKHILEFSCRYPSTDDRLVAWIVQFKLAFCFLALFTMSAFCSKCQAKVGSGMAVSGPLDVKLALEWRFRGPLDVKLALEWRFWRPLDVKLALEWRLWDPWTSSWPWNDVLGAKQVFPAAAAPKPLAGILYRYICMYTCIYIYIYILGSLYRVPSEGLSRDPAKAWP